MEIKLQELLPIQKEVNRIVVERAGRNITVTEFILAFNVELFEFMNEIGTWKWWKQSHQVKRERVLDELADCFAFFLSAIDLQNQANIVKFGIGMVDKIEEAIQGIFDELGSQYDEYESSETVNSLITLMGTDNEFGEEPVSTTGRFAASIYAASRLFEGITWEEITDAYKKKSAENIKRQQTNY